MPLILAIEPDRRQAAQLSVVVRKRVHAELILVDTTERALDAIGNRMPDLVLVPALLSPQDDVALAAALRVIAAAASVQMLTIPVLGAPRPAPVAGGVLSALRRGKARTAEPDGCDPAVFAEQIASYLERAAQERGNAWPPEAPVEVHPPIARAAVEASPSYEHPAPSPSGTLEDALSQEWLESLPPENNVNNVTNVSNINNLNNLNHAGSVDDAVAQISFAAPDESESVSFALEQAVRNLFADPAPAAVVPAPATVSAAPAFQRRVAVEKPPVQDEWIAVDDLMAALKLMPLSAIEVTDDDEWIGPVLDAPYRALEALEDDLDQTADSKAVGGKSEREWVTLIASLRHDVERLRVERSEKPGRTPAAAQAQVPVPAPAARPERKQKPIQDEWGLFDPEQCGFAALLAKLDEVTESEDNRWKQ